MAFPPSPCPLVRQAASTHMHEGDRQRCIGRAGYLATLCNQDSDAWRIHVGWADLDPVAVGAIIVLTILICLSTKESGRFNTVLVVTKLLGVVFVIVAGAQALAIVDCSAGRGKETGLSLVRCRLLISWPSALFTQACLTGAPITGGWFSFLRILYMQP